MKKEYTFKVNITENKEKCIYEGVIFKKDNKWRIRGKGGKLWKAEYKTKTDAEDGLKAYFANKNENINKRSDIIEKLEKKLEDNYGYNNVTIVDYIFNEDNTIDVYFEYQDEDNDEIVTDHFTFEQETNENKTKKIKESLASIKENFSLLREYIDLEGDVQHNSHESKETIISGQFIDNIRKAALDAMNKLADSPQSEEFQVLTNIFNITQKFHNKL